MKPIHSGHISFIYSEWILLLCLPLFLVHVVQRGTHTHTYVHVHKHHMYLFASLFQVLLSVNCHFTWQGNCIQHCNNNTLQCLTYVTEQQKNRLVFRPREKGDWRGAAQHVTLIMHKEPKTCLTVSHREVCDEVKWYSLSLSSLRIMLSGRTPNG